MKEFIAALLVAIVAFIYIEACTHSNECHHGKEAVQCEQTSHPVCNATSQCDCSKPTHQPCTDPMDCGTSCDSVHGSAHCIHGMCHCTGN